jgi:hypothetical protein
MRATFLKWMLFILIAAGVPLVLAAPMVGNVHAPLFLLTFESLGYFRSLSPFSIMVGGQLVAYVVIIYWASRYLANGAMRYHKILVFSVFAIILVGGLFPVFGPNGNERVYDLYAGIIRF